MIPFGEWLPDLGTLNNPGAQVAKNVVPHVGGYAPILSPAVYSAALTARCRGGISARDNAGAVYTYAGDETKLQALASDGTWTDVTRDANPYATAANDRWDIIKWDETLIATNGTDEIQTCALDGTSKFTDLGGTPPTAKAVTTSRNFVILGNVNDGTAYPSRVHWSALDDPTDWTPSAVTQCDYQDIRGNGGPVLRLFGGESAVVLCENSVWRMTFVGTPIVWQFDEVGPNIGLLAPGLAAQDGRTVYWLSKRGFHRIRDGEEMTPIGVNRVDEYVLSDLDTSYLERCTAAVDARSHHIFFAYPGEGNVQGEANKMVIYDPALDRWSYSEQTTQALLTSATVSYTMDSLDTYNADLDAITIPLDDDVWAGGRDQLAKFDGDNKLNFFSGSPMAAVIETGEVQINPSLRTLLTAVRPVIEGGASTIQAATRDIQTESVTWTAAATPTANGRANIRKNARYHQFRANLSGEWTHAYGVEPQASKAGWR